MKQYQFYLLSANKLVFSDKRYLFGFLAVAFAMFWLLLYIPIRTIPGNDLAFQLSILTPKDWFLFTILPVLTALSIVMNVYILKNKHSLRSNDLKGSAQDGAAMAGQGGTGFLSGIIASVFGTATCASCVATIFGFFRDRGSIVSPAISYLYYRSSYYFTAHFTLLYLQKSA